MLVLVVFVVPVHVGMNEMFVVVNMAVTLGDVEPDADHHHDGGQPEG